MNNTTVNMVFDDDIEQLLKSLDVYESFIQGHEECIVCGTQMTIENFIAVLPHNLKIAFCCSKPECYFSVLRRAG